MLKATGMWTQAVKICIVIKHTFHLLLKKLNARALIFKINWDAVQGSWVNLSGRASAKAGCQRSSLQFNCLWQGQNLWVLMRAPPARFSPVDTGASHFHFPALWPTTCPYTSRLCFTFPLSPYTLTPATVACAAVPPLKVGPWTKDLNAWLHLLSGMLTTLSFTYFRFLLILTHQLLRDHPVYK